MTTQELTEAQFTSLAQRILEHKDFDDIDERVVKVMKEAALMFVRGEAVERNRIERVWIIQEVNPESEEILHVHGSGYVDSDIARSIVYEHNSMLGESESFRTKYKSKSIRVHGNE